MHQIQLLRKYQIRPRKAWGQNFLIDENLQRKIIEGLSLARNDYVLEIGAGLGALTQGLLQTGAHVYAVEKDESLVQILQKELGHYSNLFLVNRDILKLDLKTLPGKSGGKTFPPSLKWKVVGNLPYFLTTPILFYLIEQRKRVEQALVMVQKEVADRILALPGSKVYGRLTLAFRYFADVEHLLDVNRQVFRPVPLVDSTVLGIRFHHRKVKGLDEDLLFKVIQAAFAARRKNILNCLSNSHLSPSRVEWKKILEELKIPVNFRAEELLLKDYIDLTKKVSS